MAAHLKNKNFQVIKYYHHFNFTVEKNVLWTSFIKDRLSIDSYDNSYIIRKYYIGTTGQEEIQDTVNVYICNKWTDKGVVRWLAKSHLRMYSFYFFGFEIIFIKICFILT